MFDVSFPELMVIAVVALLVLGPERLPIALRTMGLWIGRLRRSFMTIKGEVEREIGMDEVRRQLHNESIMHDLKRIEHEVRSPAIAPMRHNPTTTATPKIDTPPGETALSASALSDGASGEPTVTENDRATETSRQG